MATTTRVFKLLVILLAVALTAFGQSQTGQISGLITDATGAVVIGATIQLSHDLTGNTREFKSESNGSFVFPNLLPGAYTLRITQAGFKTFEQKNIIVSPSERVDMHEIKLEVGSANTSVEVTANAARVQTASAERAGLITPTQVETIPNRGRDYLGLLRTLPGVLDTSNRDAPGATGAPQVNGGQTGQFLVTLDGVPNQDVGYTGGSGFLTPSVDAIGEVKVMLSGSQAEYGARSGGQMSVSIKNGTKEFHGSAYYFWRHEMFNANAWNNNRQGIARPKYRFKNPGYTIGGPVLIPFTGFNKSRNKLFFFWSHDILLRRDSAVNNVTFPTALERGGNFSQSYDGTTNQVITLKDPTIAGAVLPGNILPANLQSAAGKAILNLFPLPTGPDDPTGRHAYNSRYILPRSTPQDNEILRMDWNVNSKTLAYGRFIHDYKGTQGPCSVYLICNTSWPMLDGSYDVRSNGVVATVVHTFTPTLVNETMYGINLIDQSVFLVSDLLAGLNRDTRGLSQSVLPQFYPSNNPLNVIPSVGFGRFNNGGNIANAANTNFDQRFPFAGTEKVQTISDNLSWVKGPHLAKFGFYMEHTNRWTRRGAGASVFTGYFNGLYDFGSDPFNGGDTGWGYANALAGVVTQYRESNRAGEGQASYNRIEWFAQDTWKVSRRLSLDLGVRFTLGRPVNSVDQPLALFGIANYKAGANPPLIMPACTTGTLCPSGAKRVSKDPVTGQMLPQALIGALSNSAGTAYQAMTLYKGAYYNNPPMGVSPRFGFAWDVLGNGKLAVRGGFDILYDAQTGSVDDVLSLTDVPPATMIQTLNYTTLASMKTAPNYNRISSVTAGQRDYVLPATFDWHFGVQRDVGLGMVLDVSYVGNTTRHQPRTTNLNAIPPGTTWSGSTFTGFNPAVVDSTNNQPLPANFLAPYQGYGAITYREWSGSSNYNALQVMLNRRFGNRLVFGGNYTFSRTLTYGHTPYYADRLSYSPGNTRKHNFNVNWTYKIPDGSFFWKNVATKFVLDGWQYTGYASILSGSSASVSYSVTGVPSGFDMTGSPSGGVTRIQIVDPANIWKTSTNYLDSGLNSAAFAVPQLATRGLGNGPPVLFWGPGSWGCDMTLFKFFKLAKEKPRTLEFRVETYNTFNHPNLGNPNTSFQTTWNNGNFGPNTNIYFGRYDSQSGNVAINSTSRVAVIAAKIRF